jgi:hypothetical protein
MSEAREQEIRALKDLRSCEGWRVLSEAVRTQWQGEPFVAKLRSAAGAKSSAEAVTETVRELLAQRAAIEAVMLWPEQRGKKLEADAKADAAGLPDVERRA